MKTAFLGLFGDYESARHARAKLLLSDVPIDWITLTAMQGPGQSRIHASPAARDKLVSSLRALFKYDRDPTRAERLADRVERGAATVSACAHNAAAAGRVAAVFRDCGAVDIVRDTRDSDDADYATADHEETWPSYLWPAT